MSAAEPEPSLDPESSEVEGVPPFARGHVLAPGYEVVEHLSRGDALDVYDVWSDERFCSCVAKVVRPERRHEARVRDRLILEGEVLLDLLHPHLVRAYAMFRDPDPVVILETLPGDTLEDAVATAARRLPAVDLAYLGMHLCSALHVLHAAGYLHLDLKPANVIAHLGVAKVIDLSLARPPGRAPKGCGTHQYMAPEQARGDQVSSATDVWGLGVTLYEAASGVEPFGALSDAEMAALDSGVYLQLQRPAPSLRRWRRNLPPELCRLVEGCLEPDPGRRPTVMDVAAALKPLTGDPLHPVLPRATAESAG